MADKSRYVYGKDAGTGKVLCWDDADDINSFEQLKVLLNKSVNSGSLFNQGVVSTYSLVYTTAGAYFGGVLAPNGDIHFVPGNAVVGQKISTFPGKPFPNSVCLSPFFNKL